MIGTLAIALGVLILLVGISYFIGKLVIRKQYMDHEVFDIRLKDK